MREIWSLQHRFRHKSGKRPFRLLDHPRFRAAYDFLVLRSQAGEADPALAQWWTDFQALEVNEQQQMARASGNREEGGRRRRRRRRRRSKPAGERSD